MHLQMLRNQSLGPINSALVSLSGKIHQAQNKDRRRLLSNAGVSSTTWETVYGRTKLPLWIETFKIYVMCKHVRASWCFIRTRFCCLPSSTSVDLHCTEVSSKTSSNSTYQDVRNTTCPTFNYVNYLYCTWRGCNLSLQREKDHSKKFEFRVQCSTRKFSSPIKTRYARALGNSVPVILSRVENLEKLVNEQGPFPVQL